MMLTGRSWAGLVREAERSVAHSLIFLVQLYRHLVSPLRPATCRFIPTCSQYSVDALTEYGVVRGGWLTVARLVKCGPWHRGGWDPIPEPHERGTDIDDTSTGRGSPAKSGEGELFV